MIWITGCKNNSPAFHIYLLVLSLAEVCAHRVLSVFVLLYSGKQESMWEMWHIKFTHDLQLFTLYSNMQNHASENHGLLCTNRKEDGLHYSGASKDNTEKLLKQWDPTFANFPANDQLVLFNYDGKPCTQTCCFSALCQPPIYRFFQRSFREKLALMFSWS